jgi:AcrR family transcriptional regulator
MNQVAAACGVTKATLYHYYRDKHEPAGAHRRRPRGRLQALVAEVEPPGLPPEARLRTLIERFMPPTPTPSTRTAC